MSSLRLFTQRGEGQDVDTQRVAYQTAPGITVAAANLSQTRVTPGGGQAEQPQGADPADPTWPCLSLGQ